MLMQRLLTTEFQFVKAPVGKKTRNIYSLPDGFRRPVFVFPPDPDQLRDVQQVIQGIGSVPEFMLFPEAGGHR